MLGETTLTPSAQNASLHYRLTTMPDDGAQKKRSRYGESRPLSSFLQYHAVEEKLEPHARPNCMVPQPKNLFGRMSKYPALYSC